MNALTAIKAADSAPVPNHNPSSRAKRRFNQRESAPLFIADWMNVLFIHYEVDRERLQPSVPFGLDCIDGRAYVSLVAFSMRRLRPTFGGSLTAFPFKVLGETRFLKVRTYVRHDHDSGIYFIKEFMSSRLSAPLGPLTYGLPYHFARLEYDCRDRNYAFDGRIKRIEGRERRLRFSARIRPRLLGASFPGAASHDEVIEFLTEQYTAYTCHRGKRRLFRIWHKPWPLHPATVTIEDQDLLNTTGDWLKEAHFVGAQYSPGVRNVWMGPPRRVSTPFPGAGPKHRHTAFLELP